MLLRRPSQITTRMMSNETRCVGKETILVGLVSPLLGFLLQGANGVGFGWSGVVSKRGSLLVDVTGRFLCTL